MMLSFSHVSPTNVRMSRPVTLTLSLCAMRVLGFSREIDAIDAIRLMRTREQRSGKVKKNVRRGKEQGKN